MVTQARTSNDNSQCGDSSPAAQNDGLQLSLAVFDTMHLEMEIDAGAAAGRLVYGHSDAGRDAKAEMMIQAMREFGVDGVAATSVVAVRV